MFLSADALEIQYGIDGSIAKFFVDREPPADNLYWKDKLLYLRPQPGYIFIPLIIDLYFRSGIPKEQLLSEAFVQTIENICHYAAQQEFGVISKEEGIQQCEQLVADCTKDIFLLQSLHEYFTGKNGFIVELATPFSALHRGDLFLFALCVLPINTKKQRQLVQTWFALISTLLLLDDAEDYIDDKEKGEENAFIESGSSQEGFDRIRDMLSKNLDHISAINSSLANALHRKLVALADKPGIKEYLNA
jgi:hypothetical protein